MIEGAPHGLAHFMIGGKNGDFSGMMSPNDPFFWLHHAYLDKVWNDWQNYSKERYKQYNGIHRGHQVSSFDRMSPWKIPVHATFNIADLCYQYQPFSRITKDNKTNPDNNVKVPNIGIQIPDNDVKVPKIGIKIPDSDVKVPNIGIQIPDKDLGSPVGADLQFPVVGELPLREGIDQVTPIDKFKAASFNENISNNQPLIAITNSTAIQLVDSDVMEKKLILDGDEVDFISESNDNEKSPIPDEWIKHHGMDVEKFRSNERLIKALADEESTTTTNSAKCINQLPYYCLYSCIIFLLFQFKALQEERGYS